jgi:hypothetical protein
VLNIQEEIASIERGFEAALDAGYNIRVYFHEEKKTIEDVLLILSDFVTEFEVRLLYTACSKCI